MKTLYKENHKSLSGNKHTEYFTTFIKLFFFYKTLQQHNTVK